MIAGLRPRQLAIWSLLGLLVASAVVIETTGLLEPKVALDRHGHVIEEAVYLLPVPLDQLSAIEIAVGGEVYRFERDHHGAWFHHHHDHHADGEADHGHAAHDGHHEHHAAAEDAETIGSAFAALARTRIERRLEPVTNPAHYGVMKPDVLINVYGDDHLSPLARYAIGDIAPDTVSRYVMTVGSFAVLTIPNYQIENLLTLVKAVAR
ncbi:MAG: DUF4340 domain-containing protein [Alphaproteobacteria bacterium]